MSLVVCDTQNTKTVLITSTVWSGQRQKIVLNTRSNISRNASESANTMASLSSHRRNQFPSKSFFGIDRRICEAHARGVQAGLKEFEMDGSEKVGSELRRV